MIRRSLALGTLFVAAWAVPAAAQSATATAAASGASAAHAETAPAAAPAHSLEVPRRFVGWFWETKVDSLWAHMSDDLRGRVGSAGAIADKAFEVMGRFGAETAVLEETITAEGEELVYERVVELEAAPGPMVFIWHYRPDGIINNVNMRPKE